ncbi:nuclear transport factor 2 family protein [Streptomyces endophyticus]|uniref:Nuclear transport factor 2 family protein n=1 Tax=Streptomyces endophyticus TaxID=714166 RepID=A0ABU6F2Z9_9ACTN|nr:nuclear transport factor 2 family protein [Streptomyces endophyticus]MEB8338379.1 nuclear transport factor 2 family protein [Streptomyces endophyticus]
MPPFADTDAATFIAAFFDSLTSSTVRGDSPDEVMERHFTPDIVQFSDGIRLDHKRLRDHLRPVARNVTGWRFEVHEAFAEGTHIAARLTIHATGRKGGPTATDVHLFADFTDDGRMHRAHQLTRMLPAPDAEEDLSPSAP